MADRVQEERGRADALDPEPEEGRRAVIKGTLMALGVGIFAPAVQAYTTTAVLSTPSDCDDVVEFSTPPPDPTWCVHVILCAVAPGQGFPPLGMGGCSLSGYTPCSLTNWTEDHTVCVVCPSTSTCSNHRNQNPATFRRFRKLDGSGNVVCQGWWSSANFSGTASCKTPCLGPRDNPVGECLTLMYVPNT